MGTLLDDAAVIHHEDLVGITDRGQAMGDDEARPPQHQLGHGALDEDLGPRVHGTGRLVEDEDAAVRQERPGDREELLLALRHARGVVVEDGVVAIGQGPDEVVHVGGLGCGDDLFLGRIFAAVGDVLADGAVEQPRVLEDHPEGRAQLVARHRRAVDAVHGDPSGIDLVEAHEQVDQRRLARTGRPDDRDRVARFHDQVQVLDEGRVRDVPERHALELDAAADRAAQRGDGRVGGLLGLVEQLEHPLGGRDRGLDDVGDAGGLGDRHRELAGVLDEGLDVAEAHLAVRDLDAADDADQRRS